MAKPARTWVTADWHLFHWRLVELGERPEDFQVVLLGHHMRLLGPQDTLIHLGDVLFYQHPRLKGLMESIAGTKILVMGNHDTKSRGWYMRNGFAYAADMIVAAGVAFSHRPLATLPEGATVNVHGHLHRHRDHPGRQPWHRLVAMEDTGYRPVLLDTLVR